VPRVSLCGLRSRISKAQRIVIELNALCACDSDHGKLNLEMIVLVN